MLNPARQGGGQLGVSLEDPTSLSVMKRPGLKRAPPPLDADLSGHGWGPHRESTPEVLR